MVLEQMVMVNRGARTSGAAIQMVAVHEREVSSIMSVFCYEHVASQKPLAPSSVLRYYMFNLFHVDNGYIEVR